MKKTVNIATVVYSHYSRDARVRRYAESLVRRGFEVDVVCLKEEYKPKQTNISLIQYPLPRRRLGRLWYISEYILFFIYTFLVLSIKFFTRRYKVIHINNMPEVLVFASLIPKMFGAKIILDMHDPMPELYMSKFHVAENNPAVKLLRIGEKLSMDFADFVLTANVDFKKIFLSRKSVIPNKISVILNCPDPRIFNPINNYQLPITNKSFTLLYMGTVEKRFGLDIVMDAMPDLIVKIPTIKFVIIPKLEEEGEYLKNLKSQISNLKLGKYIKIFPPQPLEIISKYIKQADIGVVLAKNGIFTESIFPVKLLEFIQMGIPVIATKTKILSQYFSDKQICFLRENTSAEFAQTVVTFYRNKNLRKSFSQNAKDYLRKYNWGKEEKKYLDIINSSVDN